MTLVKKLTRIGNSTGVILPADFLMAAGIEDEVEISVKDHQIILSPTDLRDHKVMKTFMSVLHDYDETLKKLAK